MRKYFQFAAWLVVTMLGACSGGTESKEAADISNSPVPPVKRQSRVSIVSRYKYPPGSAWSAGAGGISERIEF